MSEDKMREEFEATLKGAYLKRHANGGGYVDPEISARWATFKACAAIKDAEIAELKKLSVTNILMRVVPDLDGHGCEEYAKSVSDVEDLLSKLSSEVEDYELGIKVSTCIQDKTTKEIAARDLMIKELREALRTAVEFLGGYMHPDIEQALTKSEHHNSRALEKMLLAHEIGVLEDLRNAKLHSNSVWTCEELKSEKQYAEAKLAELNKE